MMYNISTPYLIIIVLLIIAMSIFLPILLSNDKNKNKSQNNSQSPRTTQNIQNNPQSYLITQNIQYNQQSLQQTQNTKSKSPYIICNKLLTNHELSFYKDLRYVTDYLGYIVMCKVRLADIAIVPDSYPNKNNLFNAVRSKHLDFVICANDTTPLFVIELDDYTHDWASTKIRDQIKNDIFANSRVKLLRYRNWSIEQIKNDITLHNY